MMPRSLLSLMGEGIPNYRFLVNVDDIYFALFSEVTLPTLTTQTDDVIEGGQNHYIHKLPSRVDAGTISLKKGMSTTMDMLDWYMDVFNGNWQNARRSVMIVVFNTMRTPILFVYLANAYPVKWTGPTLKTDGAEVALDEVELAFTEIQVQYA